MTLQSRKCLVEGDFYEAARVDIQFATPARTEGTE